MILLDISHQIRWGVSSLVKSMARHRQKLMQKSLGEFDGFNGRYNEKLPVKRGL
jgi:hypothetical protein